MPSIIELGLSFAMIVGPTVGYIDQYFLIRRKQSSAGFNPISIAILLFANILRIYFWFGKRFDTTLLLQSIVMIIAMLLLLQVVVRYKNHESFEALYSELRSSFSSNSIEEDLRAEENGLDLGENRSQSGRVSSIRKWWRMPFWGWDHYLDYINFLLFFTACIGGLYFFLGQYTTFIEVLGTMSLTIESTLPLPQCISNFRNRSTKGFSLLVLATWFLGDGFKLFYFLINRSPVQFIICGAIQLTVDSLIVLEFILFSTYVKSKFKSTSWINKGERIIYHQAQDTTDESTLLEDLAHHR